MGKAGVEGAWQHRWATAAGRGCRHRVNRHDDDHAGMLLRPQWLSEKEECAGEKTDQQEDGQGVGDDLTKLHCSSPIHASLSATSASKLCSMFGTNAPGSQDFSPSCGSSDKRTTCLCTGRASAKCGSRSIARPARNVPSPPPKQAGLLSERVTNGPRFPRAAVSAGCAARARPDQRGGGKRAGTVRLAPRRQRRDSPPFGG